MSAFKRMWKTASFKDAYNTLKHRWRYAGRDADGNPSYADFVLPRVRYAGTVKIHGTNSSFCRLNPGCTYGKSGAGDWIFQSKRRTVTPDNDNCGFARAMTESLESGVLEEFLEELVTESVGPMALTAEGVTPVVYGEWAGEGIHGGTAMNQLDRKIFIAFDVTLTTRETADESEGEDNTPPEAKHHVPVLKDPETLSRFNEAGFYVATQFKTYDLVIDFENPREAADIIEGWVRDVEVQCPVGAALGAEGIGEGIVFRPVEVVGDTNPFVESRLNTSGIWFKAKGEKHKHSRTKNNKVVEIDYEKMASVKEFVEANATEVRMQQALEFLREEGLPIDKTSTGHFVQWILRDVAEEEAGTLEASELTEKDIRSELGGVARKWFFEKLREDWEKV